MNLYLFFKVFSTFLLYLPIRVDFCAQELSLELTKMFVSIFFLHLVTSYTVPKMYTLTSIIFSLRKETNTKTDLICLSVLFMTF